MLTRHFLLWLLLYVICSDLNFQSYIYIYFIAEDKDDDDEVRAVGNTLDCGLADGKSETDAHTGSESAMESENVQEETSIST